MWSETGLSYFISENIAERKWKGCKSYDLVHYNEFVHYSKPHNKDLDSIWAEDKKQLHAEAGMLTQGDNNDNVTAELSK